MATETKLLIIQFLEWIDARPRNRADVQEAWQSTCPLACVWEDAVSDDLVAAGPSGHLVVTEKGRALMAAAEPVAAKVEDQHTAEDERKAAE